MSAMSEYALDLDECGSLDAEDDAAGRRAEYAHLRAMVDLADLAYYHAHPELFPQPQEA